MKSLLISINPKWCELIVLGKKTIELRKTRPKIDTPFKCYIYETKDKDYDGIGVHWENGRDFLHNVGKVIGEFVCNYIFPIKVFEDGVIQDYMFNNMCRSCVPYGDISEYIGNGNTGYGWHISDLVIYDKPRKLSDFATFCKGTGYATDKTCKNCRYLCFDDDPINGYTRFCGANKRKTLTRPPQSWCYIEERS